MYLPSTTPILTQQRADAARHGAESDARIENMRRTSACGRAELFRTLVNPQDVAANLGVGAAVNTAKLQSQTDVSRASGILGGAGNSGAPGSSGIPGDSFNSGNPGGAGLTIAEIIAGAPEVVSLNRGGACSTPGYTPVPLGPDPVPGMPHRAPEIVNGPNGPMYFRGADATYQGGENAHASQGLSGYAPAWGDAGLVTENGAPAVESSWLMEHPWLAIGLAAAGLVALSRRSKA